MSSSTRKRAVSVTDCPGTSLSAKMAAPTGRMDFPRGRPSECDRSRSRVVLGGDWGILGRDDRGRRRDLVLDASHHDVGACLAVLEDRVRIAVEALVDRSEVEADLRVLPRDLQGSEERRLGIFEPAELEADEPEIVVEGVGFGAFGDQLPVDFLGLLELLLTEVDEARAGSAPSGPSVAGDRLPRAPAPPRRRRGSRSGPAPC